MDIDNQDKYAETQSDKEDGTDTHTYAKTNADTEP